MLKSFPELHPDDVKSQIMGVNGEDIVLSPRAREVLPLSIEVKRRKRFATLYEFVEQAKQDGKYEPVVFLRADHEKWLTLINMEYYLSLLRR